MSTQMATARPTCGECGEVVDLDDVFQDAFCGPRCYYVKRGRGPLEALQAHGSFCASCFGQLFDSFTPLRKDGKPVPSNALDRRFPTPKATRVVDESPLSDRGDVHSDVADNDVVWADPETGEWFDNPPVIREEDPRSPRVAYERWGCECGAVNPAEDHAAIRSVDPEDIRQNLFAGLMHLSETGAIQQDPDKEALRGAYRDVAPPEPSTDAGDWAYIAGRAIYDGDDANHNTKP